MKKLLVILGAGSSIPVGMPSVSAIDYLMAGWSDEWTREQRLDNYYRKTWDAVASYYAASTASIRPTPNFEKVLGEMIALAHWIEPSPFGHALRQLISPDGQPLGMSFNDGAYAVTVSVTDQVTYLLKKLAEHMRAQSASARITAEGGYPQYKALFDRLRATFDVGVFNLNYDTAVLTAWPEAFAGFQRLISNLKHVLVGLEMKAALIVPHAKQGKLLFESYFHMLNFEFCVGMFSICEGLGSALWLRENNLDGSAANKIPIAQWKPSLTKKFDPGTKSGLGADVDTVKSVRDKLHQDQLGARASIDWHAFSYDKAFKPAARAMRCLLNTSASDVPKKTNLTAE